MDIMEAIDLRHSVRQYLDKPIDEDLVNNLKKEIEECNKESGLHIQLVLNEPKAFDTFMAHYGKFQGVTSYIALIGKKDSDLEEKCGYYGERLVLKVQQLGLNSCWVALTYKKIPSAFTIKSGEKLVAVIAIGYGKTQGTPHKSKSIEQVSNISSSTPSWFIEGVKTALKAPTALNQQKFKIIFEDGKVIFKEGMGFYTKIDLGIVKFHFEIGSKIKNV